MSETPVGQEVMTTEYTSHLHCAIYQAGREKRREKIDHQLDELSIACVK